MKFVFFPVSENGENGLGDEAADGAMPPPPLRIFGLEPPLLNEGVVICESGSKLFKRPSWLWYGVCI